MKRVIPLSPSRLIVLLAASLAAAGCSSEMPISTGDVSGTVSFRGQPVKEGVVVFESQKQGFIRGFEIQGGNFTGKGVPAGSYKVAVTPKPLPPEPVPNPNPSSSPKTAPKAEDIPEKYHTSATSGLTAEVAQKDNKPFEFKLE